MTLQSRTEVSKAIAVSLALSAPNSIRAMHLEETAQALIEMGTEARRHGYENGDTEAIGGGRRLIEVGRRLLEVGVAMKQAKSIK